MSATLQDAIGVLSDLIAEEEAAATVAALELDWLNHYKHMEMARFYRYRLDFCETRRSNLAYLRQRGA